MSDFPRSSKPLGCLILEELMYNYCSLVSLTNSFFVIHSHKVCSHSIYVRYTTSKPVTSTFSDGTISSKFTSYMGVTSKQ